MDHRSPAPPEALAGRIRELVAASDARREEAVPERLLQAAQSVLARLLRDECKTRQSALDLLAADALATYAFEAAADEPERIVERTDLAMAAIAALADLPAGSELAADAPRECR
jgi:hypothetical protein